MAIFASQSCPLHREERRMRWTVNHIRIHSSSSRPRDSDFPIQICFFMEVFGICRTGSSNGLICILLGVKDLILWNPSTRKSKKLPPIGTNLKIYRHIVAYGFGFDEYKDDYNVVLIVRLFEEERGYKYSLRTDSWKRSTSPGTSSGFIWEIICLDLESGVCGRLDQPDYGGSDIALTLGMLGGCLCILCYEIDTRVDVWVLKDYGVKGSWTKLFRFPCIHRGGRFVFLKPLCMLPNGEILLIFGRSLVLCNPAYGSFRVREATNFDRVEIYVETLVSPAVLNEECIDISIERELCDKLENI
ncbi:F-box/kelch-repeat protein At3g23880-like [Primulina huaijiensis]|uniref:F-box/kelch-repeat protein At3g23880-like n=1 Tax=Primulina huaijiensis TaxID=1492673 RepID=UPI003CC6E7D7